MENQIKTKIRFKSKLIGLTIAKRNKAFDKLSDEDKRKEIAFDCLQLVIGGKLNANSHLSGYWNHKLFDIKTETPQEFQNILVNKLPEDCKVCVRGGLMLSQIRLGNSVTSTDNSRYCGDVYNLKGFSVESFYNMEKEYERSVYNHPHLANSIKKIANICCNVIKNGDFDINDKTDYLK